MSGNEQEPQLFDWPKFDRAIAIASKITHWRWEWRRAKEIYRDGNETQRHDQGAGRFLGTVDAGTPDSRVESDVAKDVGR